MAQNRKVLLVSKVVLKVFWKQFFKEISLLLQYLHFYVSYIHNFFTDVLPWCQEIFWATISYVWNDFSPVHSYVKICVVRVIDISMSKKRKVFAQKINLLSKMFGYPKTGSVSFDFWIVLKPKFFLKSVVEFRKIRCVMFWVKQCFECICI